MEGSRQPGNGVDTSTRPVFGVREMATRVRAGKTRFDCRPHPGGSKSAPPKDEYLIEKPNSGYHNLRNAGVNPAFTSGMAVTSRLRTGNYLI